MAPDICVSTKTSANLEGLKIDHNKYTLSLVTHSVRQTLRL